MHVYSNVYCDTYMSIIKTQGVVVPFRNIYIQYVWYTVSKRQPLDFYVLCFPAYLLKAASLVGVSFLPV